MKYDNQLRYAVNIINDYDGRAPLAAWLKDFFRANKQMGSRDRKTVSEMVYGFYRLGHIELESIEKRILKGISLSNNLPDVKEYFFPSAAPANLSSQDEVDTDLTNSLLHPESTTIFPWQHLLSEDIDKEAFALSFLTQPDLFLRVRPGYKEAVQNTLEEAGITYDIFDDACIALPNSTKIDGIIKINKEAVVQDRSSQRTGDYIKEAAAINPSGQDKALTVWDSCAASGGKSIMAFDLLKNIDLTVSDKRSSIMDNLHVRFAASGIKEYSSFVADLTGNSTEMPAVLYDLVIADVPCTGSGTWARTPEQLYFFKEEKIAQYSNLQKKILDGIVTSIKPGGSLIYITCSVFAKENEDVAKYLQDEHKLTLVKAGLVKGYKQKADTLFAAIFTAPST